MRFWPRSVTFDDDPAAVLLPEPLRSEVRALLTGDRYVGAVRRVRRRTQLGLFVAAPLVGHVLPLVPLAVAFREAGHEVMVATAGDGVAAAERAGVSDRGAGMRSRSAS